MLTFFDYSTLYQLKGALSAVLRTQAHPERKATMKASADANIDVEALVNGAKHGDEASFAALYEHYFDRIYRYVSFKLRDPVEAEDVTGEVFLKMLESIHSFRWQGFPFSSWLFRIAHNMVVDHFRRKDKRPTVYLDEVSQSVGAYSWDVEGFIDRKLTLGEVYGAMSGLTDLQREVITLRFAGELSLAETAEVVGRKANAVKALQHVGLKKLRSLMEKEPSLAGAVRCGEA